MNGFAALLLNINPLIVNENVIKNWKKTYLLFVAVVERFAFKKEEVQSQHIWQDNDKIQEIT